MLPLQILYGEVMLVPGVMTNVYQYKILACIARIFFATIITS